MCVRPALTTRQCQGREGVAEIVAWNYDAHTPNFPSLSEVRAPGYVAGRRQRLLSSNAEVPRASLPGPSLPRLERYTARLCLPTSLFSRVPRHRPSHLYRSDIIRQNTRAWQRRSAPSNQKPIICLHVPLRRSASILTAALSKIASRKLRDHRPTRN